MPSESLRPLFLASIGPDSVVSFLKHLELCSPDPRQLAEHIWPLFQLDSLSKLHEVLMRTTLLAERTSSNAMLLPRPRIGRDAERDIAFAVMPVRPSPFL